MVASDGVMISVVEPYWERSAALRRQLESFAEVYAGDDEIEVVVVDDGSPTDPAYPVMQEFKDRLNLVLVQNEVRKPWERKDPCVPYNQGVEAASGKILVLSQADIGHQYDCLRLMRDLFLRDEESRVMYPCSYDPHEGPHGYYRANPWRVFPAFDCLMLWKADYDRLGGMDPEFREAYGGSDHDFWYKIVADDLQVECVGNLCVEHNRNLCSQWVEGQERFARGQEILLRKWPQVVDFVVQVVVYPAPFLLKVERKGIVQVKDRPELRDQERRDAELMSGANG